MTMIYSPATIVGTDASDYLLSPFNASNLSGGNGNDLLMGDFYTAFEAIRAGESNNTRATAKNLESNGLMWTTASSDLYAGPSGAAYSTTYIEGQAGATRWVSFTAAAGAAISFDIDFAYDSGFGADSDLVIDLVDDAGNVLLTIDDATSLDAGSYS